MAQQLKNAGIITKAMDEPRPYVRTFCLCSGLSPCRTNACRSCYKLGLPCVPRLPGSSEFEACSCLPQNCTNVFSKIRDEFGSEAHPNACFASFLKSGGQFDILLMGRRLMGGNNPNAAVFKVWQTDEYLRYWRTDWQMPHIQSSAELQKQKLKDLIQYGLMELDYGGPLEKSIRFSVCLERWVECEICTHCSYCRTGRGCVNMGDLLHWHCRAHYHKPAVDNGSKCGLCGGQEA